MTCHYPDLGSASDWSCSEGNLCVSTNPQPYPELAALKHGIQNLEIGNGITETEMEMESRIEK